MKNKIRPCPFCGEKPIIEWDSYKNKKWWWIECCHIRSSDFKMKTKLLEWWNNRASPWKPIETAPVGVRILVTGGISFADCAGGGEWFEDDQVHLAYKIKGEEGFTVNDYYETEPTHWMELPTIGGIK